MRRPLAVFGLGFLAAQWLLLSAPLAGFLPAALLVFGFCLRDRRKGRKGYPYLLLAAGVLALGLFGAFQLAVMLPARALAGGEYLLRLQVTEAEASYGEGTVRGEARVLSLDGEKSRLRVRFDDLPDCDAGDIIEGRFTLYELPDDAYRPGYYADKIFFKAEYAGGLVRAGTVTGIPAVILRLRRWLLANIARFVPRPYRGILKMMLVGQKSALSASQQKLFRSAGLSHLLVVSGLHLSILTGFLGGGDVWSRSFRRLRAALSLGLVLLLMAVSGFGPSVCRAGVAAIVYQVGVIFLLPSDAVTSLGLAALLLGLQNPFAAGDAGLQLSVCATLGVLFSGSAVRRFESWCPVRERAKRMLVLAAGWVFPSFFAVLFILPVQLWQGFSVSGVALLANLAVLWLVKPLLLLGLGCAVLGSTLLLAPVCRIFGFGAALLARLLCDIAAILVRLPFAALPLHRWYALFVWCCLFLLGLYGWRAGCFRRVWLAAPGILLAAVVCGSVLSRDVIELTLIGNRYNPCAVILQQGEAAVLLRGGSANEREVLEYLEEHGIPRPSLLIDLRAEPGELPLTAETTVRLEELPQREEMAVEFGAVSLRLWNGREGNLALLSADGYTAAMTSGRPEFAQGLPVDLFLAGPSAPGALEPRAVLYQSGAYAWLEELPEDCLRIYSDADPMLRLRPGRSVSWKGDTDVLQ